MGKGREGDEMGDVGIKAIAGALQVRVGRVGELTGAGDCDLSVLNKKIGKDRPARTGIANMPCHALSLLLD